MNKYARMILDRRMRDGDSRYTIYRDGHYPEYERDYARRDRDYYGYRDRMDYDGYEKAKISREEADEWKHRLRNEDGTVGEHFKTEQIRRLVDTQNIRVDELGGFDTFALALNMIYSDYCAVARKYGVDRLEFYADIAKAFLKDGDFDGTPEEKLYIYYKCIVDDE